VREFSIAGGSHHWLRTLDPDQTFFPGTFSTIAALTVHALLPGPARILIVDDHPLVRYGLRKLLDSDPQLSVCGEADTIARAFDAVVALDPDLVIVDLALGKGNGPELIRRLRAHHATLRVLVFSAYNEPLFASLAIKAGADGYVIKSEPTDHLVYAVRELLAGRTYLSPWLS
jgi:DNA-binding NarL/FixJ family response regulator